jgi:hypothetical protein
VILARVRRIRGDDLIAIGLEPRFSPRSVRTADSGEKPED